MEHAKETVGAFCLGLLPHSFTCWRTLEVVVYLCTCLAAKFRSFFCSPLPYSRQQLDSICGCVLFLFSKSLAQTNGGMGMATQIGKWNQDSRQTTTQYLLMIKRNSLRILLTINVLIKTDKQRLRIYFTKTTRNTRIDLQAFYLATWLFNIDSLSMWNSKFSKSLF